MFRVEFRELLQQEASFFDWSNRLVPVFRKQNLHFQWSFSVIRRPPRKKFSWRRNDLVILVSVGCTQQARRLIDFQRQSDCGIVDLKQVYPTTNQFQKLLKRLWRPLEPQLR